MQRHFAQLVNNTRILVANGWSENLSDERILVKNFVCLILAGQSGAEGKVRVKRLEGR